MPWTIPPRPIVGDNDWNGEQEAIWSSLKSFVDAQEALKKGKMVSRVGRYIATGMELDTVNSDANVFGTSGQRVWVIPMVFDEPTAIDRFGQSIGVAGNGNLLLGLYEWGYGTVNRLAAVSTAANVVGDKEITTSLSGLHGLYAGVIGTTDTSGTLTVRRGSARLHQHTPFGTSAGWEMDSYLGAQYNGINLAGGLPATLDLSTPTTYARTDVPLLWVRKA